ncbi:MAG: DUF4080 domain-containing protein [Candidatus Hydrogenedens sp.]|nr:DUF4080 domain-containing protein [Candidatus Hydrogenedens sp.]
MSDSLSIVLATANARYAHTAFGLRCLQANLGQYQKDTQLLEFTIQQSAHEIAESILLHEPRIAGLGVHIWNAGLMARTAEILRRVSPATTLVCGGPEMSGSSPLSPTAQWADYIIRGEGEEAFYSLVHDLAQGRKPEKRVIEAPPVDLEKLSDPYDLYTEQDIAHRVIYVEASRGCPYRCAFCLSGASSDLRYFSLEPFLGSMEKLIARGVRNFKFIDRTFNVDLKRMHAILDFFLKRPEIGELHLHFEIMPDRLPPDSLELLAAFPADVLHLEAGIQSINQEIQKRIRRNQGIEASLSNLRWLREHSGCQIHGDLIFGLPGESPDSFAEGFNQLVTLNLQEIQLGLLKNLPGTPLSSLSDASTVYDSQPPYEILQNDHFSFSALQKMKRFAKYFDLYHNHGNFPESLALLRTLPPSPFHVFERFSEQIWEKEKRSYGIPLVRLAEYLFRFLCDHLPDERARIADCIEGDFRRLKGRRDHLPFLKEEDST